VAGGVLAAVAVLLAAVVGRPGQGWTLAAGSLLQVAVIATGLVVPAMFVLGAVFAVLWATAIWLGLRYREASWRSGMQTPRRDPQLLPLDRSPPQLLQH